MAETVLDVHLAEYASLRSELLNRVQIQFSATGWLLTLLAATLTAVTFIYEKGGVRDVRWLLLQALVFLPVAAAPLAFMTFDHVIMIHRIGADIENRLRPAIQRWLMEKHTLASPPDVLGWGSAITRSPATSLHAIKYIFFLFGSWLLFFLMIPVSTAVVLWGAGWNQWPYPPILIIDLVLSSAFGYTTLAILRERAGWLGPLLGSRVTSG